MATAVSASAIGIAAATTSEDHEEDDERRQQAQQLRRPLLDVGELRVAVELDDDSGRLHRVANGFLDRDDWCCILVVDHPVEPASVYAIRPSSENVSSSKGLPTSSSPALSSVGVNSELLSFGGSPRRRPPCAPACRAAGLPARRRRRSRRRPAPRRTRPRRDRSPSRIRARDLELVLEPAPRSRRRRRASPRWRSSADDAPRMTGAGAHPVREGAGRKAFVGSAAVYVVHHFFTPGSEKRAALTPSNAISDFTHRRPGRPVRRAGAGRR